MSHGPLQARRREWPASRAVSPAGLPPSLKLRRATEALREGGPLDAAEKHCCRTCSQVLGPGFLFTQASVSAFRSVFLATTLERGARTSACDRPVTRNQPLTRGVHTGAAHRAPSAAYQVGWPGVARVACLLPGCQSPLSQISAMRFRIVASAVLWMPPKQLLERRHRRGVLFQLQKATQFLDGQSAGVMCWQRLSLPQRFSGNNPGTRRSHVGLRPTRHAKPDAAGRVRWQVVGV